MTIHTPISLPTPAAQSRVDGWTPARQRYFVETLAATGVITIACDACDISPRAAYALRNRAAGAAFRLGWDAAILIARARLADDLLARAIEGQEEVISRDEYSGDVTRRRHDNRLAMSMLSRLDRMADRPPEGSDAALARVVAQDFAAYCDLLCPPEHSIDLVAIPAFDQAPPQTEEDLPAIAETLSPAASVALFLAARIALPRPADHDTKPAENRAQERCELRLFDTEDCTLRAELPPEQAAAKLRGVFWDDERDCVATDFPPPPGFDGYQNQDYYDVDFYRRDLSPSELDAYIERQEREALPYEIAAIRARDEYMGFEPIAEDDIEDADDESPSA
jgi:hypothetical protein